jgi:hypothetical protein
VIVILIVILLLLVIFIIVESYIGKKSILNFFDIGNVVVTGHKGCGKDMLFSYVTRSRKKDYISNINYTFDNHFVKFNAKLLSVGGNTFDNFINNNLKYYKYPYGDDIDYYISDCGVYFPSTYHDILVKKYQETPFFMALSRHLGECNVHCNIQNLNRLWDKIREQSDFYIDCLNTKVFFKKIVVQKVIVYDNYESALARKKPVAVPRGLVIRHKNAVDMVAMRNADVGYIKKYRFIHILPKKNKQYNTRIFKTMLEEGLK